MTATSTAWSQLATRILTVDQIRNVDRDAIERFQLSSLVLMENAALGCVQWLRERFPVAPTTVILCGRGNNGGDGLAIARHLRVHGWRCTVAVLGPQERMSPDARSNLSILLAGGDCEVLLWTSESGDVTSTQIAERIAMADIVIDAMLGTGALGEPKEPLNRWIQWANQSTASRIAIDIPTGWNASTGEVSADTFSPHATLTFVARKPAMAHASATQHLSDLAVLPIGIPALQVAELLAISKAQAFNDNGSDPI